MDKMTFLAYHHTMRIPSGFPHEVLITLPQNPAGRLVHATDLGYFPKAAGHFRRRPGGAAQDIVILCLEGRGTLWVEGGQAQDVHPGCVCLIPAGLAHEYGAADADPWTIQWVHAAGPWTAEFAAGFPRKHGVRQLSNPAFQRARAHFSDLLSLALRDDQIPRLTWALAWWLTLVLQDPVLDDTLISETKQRNAIDDAVKLLSDHIAEEWTLGRLAGMCNLSPSRFTALFKQLTGNPPMAHLNRLRIQRACSLLETSQASINEIGRLVGFEDPLYFSRFFRKSTGVSPRQWRRNPRG